MSADDLVSEQFEIIVVIEGTIQTTGSSCQISTSYVSSEILWGEHLAPLVTYRQKDGCYTIDYSHFHNTIPISTMPECSARAYRSSRDHRMHSEVGAAVAGAVDSHMDFKAAGQRASSRLIRGRQGAMHKLFGRSGKVSASRRRGDLKNFPTCQKVDDARSADEELSG